MKNIRSFRTQYNGEWFKSQLEAKWAIFLDELKLQREYEPEGYIISTGHSTIAYRPDFYIAAPFDCFLEIKPISPTEDEKQKAEALAAASEKNVIIFSGPPINNLRAESGGIQYDPYGNWDSGFIFAECEECGHLQITFCGYTNEMHCGHDTGRALPSPKLIRAAEKAKAFQGWKPDAHKKE